MKQYHSSAPYKIYVEEYGNGPIPIVLLHGAYHTGMCYTSKPDSSHSWVDYLKKEYTVYVTDLPGHGRSGYIPFAKINGQIIVDAYVEFISQLGKPVVMLTHSMSAPYGFKIAEKVKDDVLSHLVSVDPGPFGNIQEALTGDEGEVYIDFVYRNSPYHLKKDERLSPSPQFIARVTEKYTKRFPKDKKSIEKYVSSLQGEHPRLLYERFNLEGSQLCIEDFALLRRSKHLVVTSELDPFHNNDDKEIVKELQNQSVPVEHFFMPEKGILGNGHMMMLEDNSTDIIELISNWIRMTKNLHS